jgi:site-specific recombinase XerD
MLDKQEIEIDEHNYKRRLELALQNVKRSSAFSEKNKKAILSFCDRCFADKLSVERVEHYARILKKIAELFKKDFEDATKSDIVELVRKIESPELSAWTKHDYRVALRKFYKWLRNSEDYPLEVSWIKVSVGNGNRIIPEELLTEKEIEKLIVTSSDFQMKAIVAVLWETGFRIGELLNLRIKHIESEDKLAKLIVKGKTGMRRVIMVLSWPYLMQWLNLHPFKDDNSAPLWVKRSGKPMKYVDVRKRLQILARRSKIKKPVNPHMFRHSAR